MYNQIAANRQRTAFLFLIVAVILIGVGYFFSQLYGDPTILWIFVAISLIQSWFSYFYADKVALGLSGAQAVSKAEAPQLYRLVENLTITAGLPMPKLFVINSPAINALATGRDQNHASIAVTRGALEWLEKSELEGVLAHELSHVQNRDILVMTVVVTLVGLIAVVADLFVRLSWFGGRRRSNDDGMGGYLAILGFVFLLLAPLFAQLIQLAISRKREYLADASGALLTRYPEGLANALKKIEADQQTLQTASTATAHLYIANPFKNAGGYLKGLLSTHPPLEDRIRRLEEMAV